MSHSKSRSLFLTSLLFLILIATSLTSGAVSAEENVPAMWGELKPGNYKIGFRTIFTYDLSRPPVPYSDWDGRLYPTNETKGRQMQINIWFPAKLTEKSNRIEFRHYLQLMSQQTDFSAVDDAMRAFADAQFIYKTNALGGGESFTQEKLEILKKLKTNAYTNSEHVEGKFPLIVFPNGGSPAFQSIMCEFFASHGFIVAAVALKGQDSSTDDVSLKGFETAVIDLDFAVREALEIPQVDHKRICMIGNANSSSHIVAYQTRNPNIDCIVSLEGGLLSEFEQRILRQTPFYDVQSVDKPILAIYAPHPSIDPKNIEHLKYSTRYIVHFPKMSEFHFLNYGPFERFVPNIIGKPRGDVGKGFERGAELCLEFFNAHLHDDDASLKRLTQTSVVEPIDAFEVKKGLRVPPRIAFVKDSFTKQGIGYLEKTYFELKKEDPTPFSKSFYNDIKDWLAWKKDPEYKNRFRLYKLALDSYPDSSTIHYYYAYFAAKIGNKDVADKHYRKALQLLETDSSPELTVARRAQMEEVIKESLEKQK
ncbi:MAG: hypothetical protein OEM82_01700 [Acidobacteriota bacterium]|nr:hypothetical protein [Acidobacteriota bacterium]MDH3528858.1 hypothetical protein [Acidobacteriota bacterium]